MAGSENSFEKDTLLVPTVYPYTMSEVKNIQFKMVNMEEFLKG